VTGNEEEVVEQALREDAHPYLRIYVDANVLYALSCLTISKLLTHPVQSFQVR